MKNFLLRAASFLCLVTCSGFPLHAQLQSTGSLAQSCAELPASSFPPNQLLRRETGDGNAISVLQSGKSGTSAEFFVQVDKPQTYRVAVDLLKGPNRGIFQLLVNGELVGKPVDCYAVGAEASTVVLIGKASFLKPANESFRFQVTGKNPASAGSELALDRIVLTPVNGFTLLSPNGSCEAKGDVLLRWKSWPHARQYQVELDGAVRTTVQTAATNFEALGLAAGPYRWRVIALDGHGSSETSNTFSFGVGHPSPYPCREFTDDFASSRADDWTLHSMQLSPADGKARLEATGPSSALHKTVRLDPTEGELSARITLESADAAAAVGFQADDGTQLTAVLDLKRQQLRLERKLQGPMRYSIFDVTPKAYQVPGWIERAEGDALIWEIAAKAVTLTAGASYDLKLAYSRRSGCIMATLLPADGSPAVTLRDLTDLRTPDRPVLSCFAGKAAFGNVALRLLNKLVYKWNPDTTRIVLHPGEPGSWDAKGAYNPAVIVRNGTWSMVYRGNAQPAPPNGPIGSQLGLATSTDGVHWVRSPANPIIPKQSGKSATEDPDMIWPLGSTLVYLEYVAFHQDIPESGTMDASGKSTTPSHAEVMRSSSDFIHWSAPWILNFGKTWGKMGGFIDTRNNPALPAIQSGGTAYRYVSMIEEGRIDLSNDLRAWVKAGTANLKGTPDTWCSTHECSGDIFVDQDRNIRFESQIGVQPESGHGAGIVGNRLCTIGEGALSGSDPTRVLWRSDLPWLTDWYGDAPTGAPEDFTATNGSVFPGQTIVKDGWLWHFSGGNNHCVLLTKCWYGPQLDCRDLQAVETSDRQCAVHVTARNVGSLGGKLDVALLLDGQRAAGEEPVLERDTEKALTWKVTVAAGIHTLSVADLSITVGHGFAH